MAEDQQPRRPEVENILKNAAKVRASAVEAVIRARTARERVAAARDRRRRGPDSDREND